MSKLLAKERAEITLEYRNRMATLRHPAVKAFATRYAKAVKAAGKTRGYPSFSVGKGTVYASVWLNGLDSLKDERLMKVLDILTDSDSEVSSVDDVGNAYASRDIMIKTKRDGVTISATVYAVLASEPKRCRVVEVSRQKFVTEREEVKRIIVCM